MIIVANRRCVSILRGQYVYDYQIQTGNYTPYTLCFTCHLRTDRPATPARAIVRNSLFFASVRVVRDLADSTRPLPELPRDTRRSTVDGTTHAGDDVAEASRGPTLSPLIPLAVSFFSLDNLSPSRASRDVLPRCLVSCSTKQRR